MLEVFVSQQMPHAIRDSSAVVSDWRLRRNGSDLCSAHTTAWRTLDSTPIASSTLSEPRSASSLLDRPVAHENGMQASSFMGGSGLAPILSHPGSHHTAFPGTNEPSRISTNPVSTTSNAQIVKTPESQRSYGTQSEASSNTKPTSTLMIPDTLHVPQRDLSQLASEVACLFWFEPSTVITAIEKSQGSANSPSTMMSPSSLSVHITPTEGFRKWLTGLLQTTQVTQNVIILALLFIHRLKRKCPEVMANAGSEFRLMTVALMLGNKFLDDNTYTNKTWAEVSGISVHEIHTMEVEFLSNMRYSLFTTKAQWSAWHETLGKFGRAVHEFIRTQEVAAKMALLAPLPSPKKFNSPPFAYHPNGLPLMNHDSNSHTPMLLPQVSSTAISPIGSLPELGYSSGSRKRFREDLVQDPPAKRRMPDPSASSNPPLVNMPHNASQPDFGRVHLPSLTIPAQGNHLPPMHNLPAPNERAMAMVYPLVPQRGPSTQMMVPPIQTSNMITPSFNALETSRQMSPYPLSAASSPISANPHSNHLSPSYFLSQRSSPYRPVRQVKTLLHPPRAPTSIYSAPRQVSMDHLQYHSLGQPLNERHVGHVPYFQRDAWPQSYQPRQWPTQMNMHHSYVHPQI